MIEIRYGSIQTKFSSTGSCGNKFFEHNFITKNSVRVDIIRNDFKAALLIYGPERRVPQWKFSSLLREKLSIRRKYGSFPLYFCLLRTIISLVKYSQSLLRYFKNSLLSLVPFFIAPVKTLKVLWMFWTFPTLHIPTYGCALISH